MRAAYPGAAAALVGLLLAPRIAGQAIERGWVDRPALESYAEGTRAWGTHPDALLITARLQTVGWRVEA
jgi:hypothetical protein